ncbi:MAG: UDP-phosphate galactose phosphotransferase [Variovorax sp.]|nr:UDP-phosphate galactose phosphotransferase [Variovorax sp.]
MFRSDSVADVRSTPRRSSGDGRPAPLRPQEPPHRLSRRQLAAKRGLDILGASLFFLVCGPLYLFIAVWVGLSMGRPIHFWQNRLGQGGQRFRFYKFRSMVHNPDKVLEEFLSRNDAARAEWEVFQKLKSDPRITPVGKLIRRFSLDELPQFWNVLKGDMSLVGPRPCMERQRSLYGPHWDHYCSMRPGLTGLWQVSGRNGLPYSARVELDAYYVDHWSLALDLKILLMTVGVVLSAEGAR